MKKILPFVIISLLYSCGTEIKNSNPNVIIEDGTDTPNSQKEKSNTERHKSFSNRLIGYWVGYFERDIKNKYDEKLLFVDEGYFWTRENKINISIDEIHDTIVIGHSVVAGNDRPFKGTVRKTGTNEYSFKVKEPGDDKYDGEFQFKISDSLLSGKWNAYGDIEIKRRKYSLQKRVYQYNPNIMLEKTKRYIDWNNYLEYTDTVEYEENEFEEWVVREFSSASDLIYEINASNTILSKEQVENLKKGDLAVIRNTIYARHGYSFKSRPMRIFFDAQEWYIPVHSDIKSAFTKIEKENIKLLLRYEKNASEYYDYFGRG